MLDSRDEISWTFDLEEVLCPIEMMQPSIGSAIIDHLVQ
jgi:hypothetical protein